MAIITPILSTANSNALTDALKLKKGKVNRELKIHKLLLKFCVEVVDWFGQTFERSSTLPAMK